MGVRATASVLLGCLAALSGCGSSHQTITIPSLNAGGPSLPTTTAQTATAAPPSSTYPVVHWNDGPWPFTAQLVSITKSPEGFPGIGSAPPHWERLMVRVNIASQTTDRAPPTPSDNAIQIACSAPNSSSWNDGYRLDYPIVYGWDEGENAPDQTGANIGLGYQVPQVWDAEWQVPEGTDTASVKCTFNGTAALN